MCYASELFSSGRRVLAIRPDDAWDGSGRPPPVVHQKLAKRCKTLPFPSCLKRIGAAPGAAPAEICSIALFRLALREIIEPWALLGGLEAAAEPGQSREDTDFF